MTPEDGETAGGLGVEPERARQIVVRMPPEEIGVLRHLAAVRGYSLSRLVRLTLRRVWFRGVRRGRRVEAGGDAQPRLPAAQRLS